MKLGMPLHEIEDYLDWLDSLRGPERIELRSTRQSVRHAQWSPLAAAVLISIPGALAWWTGAVFLFPCLAASAFLHATYPRSPSARFYNTFAGQSVAMLSAMLVVAMFGVGGEAADFKDVGLQPLSLLACVVSSTITVLIQLLLRAVHPPAAVTTLMVTLGGFQVTWHDAFLIMGGAALVAGAGEIYGLWTSTALWRFWRSGSRKVRA